MFTDICVKEGVVIKKLTVEMLKVIQAVCIIWRMYTNVMPVITSASEKAKGRLEKSKHYNDMALDFRIRNLSSHTLELIHVHLRDLLDDRVYDIVLKKNHLHIEYDPAKGLRNDYKE